MPPLILIDIGQSRSPYVGLGQFAMQYARALLARSDDSFRFRFLAQPGFRAFAQAAPEADIVRAKLSPLGAVLRMFGRGHSRRVSPECEHQLRHALHRNFHAPHPRDRAPFVLTIHDMHFLNAPNPRAVLRQLRQNAARARAVAFISQYAQNIAEQHLDFAGKTLRVIHNGVEKPVVGAKPEWFRLNRPFLLSIAALAPHKNHIVLPEMMRRLPDFALVVAGRKDRERQCVDNIEKQIRAAGVADRVILPGAVSDGEKAWLLSHCAGFVFPSLREGFGMPVIESLHFGKPTFCLKNTALPEVGGDAAYYWEHCEPEHMAQVVRDNIGENPEAEKQRREWAARFSWETNADEHVRLYRDIIPG